MNKPTDKERAAAAGLSRSQLAEAKKAHVNTDDPSALAAYRGTVNTRSDDRNAPPKKPLSDEESVTMTIEDIELALTQKGITTNEARAFKIQLEGLKAALALKQQRSLLIHRDEIREMFSVAGGAIRGLLLAIEGSLIPKIQGKHLGEAQSITRMELNKILTSWQDSESVFWSDHKESDNG